MKTKEQLLEFLLDYFKGNPHLNSGDDIILHVNEEGIWFENPKDYDIIEADEVFHDSETNTTIHLFTDF